MADEKKTLEALEREKEELFAKLKKVSNRLRYKMYEARALKVALEQKKKEVGIDARMLRRKRRWLEFKISTEALTLKREREFMKRIRAVEKELEKAKGVERLERKLRLVEGDVKEAEGELERIKGRIGEVKKEIKAVREEERKREREKEWQERKRKELMEKKKEMAPYMGEMEEGVELGSIAVIKKKEK